MDYIDPRLTESVWNGEVILTKIKAIGYTSGDSDIINVGELQQPLFDVLQMLITSFAARASFLIIDARICL